MKKTKKFLLFVACCLMSCAMAIAFAACEGGNAESESGGNNDMSAGVDQTDPAADAADEEVQILESISLSTVNVQDEFAIGEPFTSEGLSVSAIIRTVTDGDSTGTASRVTVTNDCEIDSSDFDNTAPGEYTIYVSYSFNGTILYGSYEVEVVSQLIGTIAGLDVSYSGEQQTVLSADETTASIDLSGLTVAQVVGEDANNTAETPVERGDYELYYSKDGGALVSVDEDATEISGLTKGTYSVYAKAAFSNEEGNETFEMSGFFLYYVIDEAVSVEWNKDGDTDFEYNYTPGEADDGTVLPEVGADWTYTVTYVSGATETVFYSDVEIEGVDTDNGSDEQVTRTATVTFTDTYPMINESGVLESVSDPVTCTVDYTVGGNPDAGQVTEVVTTVNITDLAIENSDSILESIDLSGDGKIMAMANADGEIRINDNKKSIDGFEFTRRLQLRGAGSAEARSIRLTLDGAAEITVYGMSTTGGSVRTLSLYDGSFADMGQGQSNDGSAIQKFTYTAESAGTYYLAGDDGMNIYYISVVESVEAAAEGKVTEFNANDLTDGASYTEETDLTGDGVIFAVTTAEKAIQVDGNNKSFNGIDFTLRLKLGGTGSTTERAIKIVTGGAATITVYAISGSSGSDRALLLLDASGNTLVNDQIALGAPTEGSLCELTYTVDAAGEYFLASENSGINLYYIRVEEQGGATAENSIVNVGDLEDATYTAETDVSGDGTIVVTASAESTVVVEGNNKELNGVTYSKRMKLGGAGSATARSIKLTTSGAATITFYAMSSSSSDSRAVALYDGTYTAIDTTYSALAGDKLYEVTYTVDGAGTYYFGSVSGGVNVYYIAVTY